MSHFLGMSADRPQVLGTSTGAEDATVVTRLPVFSNRSQNQYLKVQDIHLISSSHLFCQMIIFICLC